MNRIEKLSDDVTLYLGDWSVSEMSRNKGELQ